MSRKPRIEYEGAFYHVIARGNQQQKVFLEDEDFRQYIYRLKSYQKRYDFTLYAYVLMSNHVHLLIEQKRTPLSRIMQGVQQSYTMYYNGKYGKTGHLFQGRYKAIICDRDSYMLELIRYIHLNPVRAGIVKQPLEYEWSSHSAYLSSKSSDWLEVERPLSTISQNKKEAISNYRAFIADGIETGHREELYQLKEQRYLGDEEFIEEAKIHLGKVEERLLPIEINMSEVVREISKAYKVPTQRIVDSSNNREGALLRGISAYVAKEIGGVTLSEAAKHFGRDQATISIAVTKLRERLSKDEYLAGQIMSIMEGLRIGRKTKYQINNV